mmetsp:Transcript_46671/g.54530  ORF Transcript_46671/g.54530 Transcript_46671/m.54530 type:complete len:352 (+) Transcript_46671:2-1057(+)
MICVGAFLMAATIIPLSVDDSVATVETCTVACIATPWFLWIGFIITFSALYSKIYRISKLLNDSNKFRRVKITVWDVMPTFCILITLTLMFLLVWSVVDPMYWIRKETIGSTDGLSTFGSCGLGHTDVSKAMLGCLIVLAFACVILACVAAWYGSNISVEYSESRYVTMIVIAMLQAFPIGIPLIILSYQNPVARYFVEIAIIFVLTMTVLLLIFIPKILFLRKEKKGRKGDRCTTLESSLRVMGTNQMVPRISVSGPISESTGITRKQVEDLKRNIVDLGTINDSTNFFSLVKSIGIPISDVDNVRNSGITNSTNDTTNTIHDATNLTHITFPGPQSTLFEEDEEIKFKP